MSFTVVIPSCARPDSLRHCLQALPEGTRVVVSDDSQDSRTREMIAADFPSVRWVEGPRRGPAANRNRGATLVETDWIAFVDDDCIPQPGWLAALEREAEGADVIEGLTIAPGKTDSPFEEHVENLNGGVYWTCNLGVRRTLFEALGGFDEAFTEPAGEDMEFAWRLRRAGVRSQFAPAACVHHPPRDLGWKGVWRRTWMVRWMPLYYLRTGIPTGFFVTIHREVLLLGRSTAQLFTRWQAATWRRQTFYALWRLISFPAVLPYLLYWDWHWRSAELPTSRSSPEESHAT